MPKLYPADHDERLVPGPSSSISAAVSSPEISHASISASTPLATAKSVPTAMEVDAEDDHADGDDDERLVPGPSSSISAAVSSPEISHASISASTPLATAKSVPTAMEVDAEDDHVEGEEVDEEDADEEDVEDEEADGEEEEADGEEEDADEEEADGEEEDADEEEADGEEMDAEDEDVEDEDADGEEMDADGDDDAEDEEVDGEEEDVEDEEADDEEEEADDDDDADADDDDDDRRWNIAAIYDSRKVATDNGDEETQYLVGWENVGDTEYPNTWNWQADIEGFGGAGLLLLYRGFMYLFEVEWTRRWRANGGHLIPLRDYMRIGLDNVCDDLQRVFPNGKNSTTFSLSNLFNSLIVFFFIPGSLSFFLSFFLFTQKTTLSNCGWWRTEPLMG